MKRIVFLVLLLCVVLVAVDVSAEVRIWTGDVVAPFRDFDYAAGAKPIHPVRIIAARGGRFSGKVCLGSTEPIKSTRAQITDLVSQGGRIPASAVRIAYPPYYGRGAWLQTPKGVPHFDDLFTTAREAKLITRKPDRKRIDYVPMNHAFQPIWLTVTVSRSAKAGDYAGTLTVTAEGAGPFTVPVKLKVHDWTLPATDDYATFVEFIQSPDSIAERYKVPMWSEKHLELVAKSFDLIGSIGSRSVYVPLLCETNMGNAHSMVRWVEKPGGGWTWDFSVMEKYLDVATRHMGKPKIVGLIVWDIFLEGGPKGKKEVDAPKTMAAGDIKRPRVSVLKDGKLDKHPLPSYTDPASAALWKPMLIELKRRLAKRGYDGALMFGIGTDYVPTVSVVSHFAKILPGVPWIHHSHSFYGGRNRKIAAGGSPVAYAAHVWCRRRPLGPSPKRYYGWQRKGMGEGLIATHYHRGLRENSEIPTYRLLAEMNVAGDKAGFGRMGADFWVIFKDKRGRPRGRVSDGRYPQSMWRNLDIRVAMFAAGPEGAVTTARFEMMREGVQECEARIFIEKTLLDETRRAKLGKTLVDKCQALLDERTRAIARAFVSERKGKKVVGNNVGIPGYETYLQWNWQQRSDDLYAAAAEVARKLGTK